MRFIIIIIIHLFIVDNLQTTVALSKDKTNSSQLLTEKISNV